MRGMQTRKVDGRMTIEGFTRRVKLGNRTIESAVERLRGNQRTIAKRLLYDFRNAYNSGRSKAPCLHRHNGRTYLRTSPSLLVQIEDYSFTHRTAKNCLEALVDKGVVAKELVRLGNDILVAIDEELLEWYEPKTSPQDPPEGSNGHMAAQKGLDSSDILKLAAKFNRKHKH